MTIERQIFYKSELEWRVEKALNFLSMKSGLKNPITRPPILNQPLPRHVYARHQYQINTGGEIGNFTLIFDEKQFLTDTQKSPYQLQMFNLIVGEEVTHTIHMYLHAESYQFILPELTSALTFVSETIGHYGGLIYSNRSSSNLFGLGAEAEGVTGEAYQAADKLFLNYRDSHFKDLINIPELMVSVHKIKQLLAHL